MTQKRLGKLPPRYTFALNPYEDTRFSRCPKCQQLNYTRKFPLLIHVEGFGLLTLGKTCRYCSKCELIIAHQDELESILAQMFAERAPQIIGNPYLALGTVSVKAWKRGLNRASTLEDILSHAADFKEYAEVGYEPGGWGPAEKE